MENNKAGKNRIRTFIYHLLYAIPMGIAIFGQMRVLLGYMAKNGMLGEGESAGYIHGLIYAGTFLGSFLIGFALSLVITLSKWTKTVFAFLIIASMTVLMIFEAEPERLLVAGLLSMIPVLAADVIRAAFEKKDETRIVFLTPFFLLFFLIIEFIPVSEKPVNWSGVAEAFERIADKGKEILDRLNIGVYDYESADIGFDGEGRLSANLRKNDREVMLLYDADPKYGEVYLAGKVYSDFDGREWTTNNENALPGRMIDTIETLSSVYETYPYNMDDVCAYTTADIVIREMRSEYAFVPYKMIAGTTGSIKVVSEGDNLYFNEKKRFGYEYKVGYYVLNREGEDLIKHRHRISGETWNSVSANYKASDGSVYSYEDLMNYRLAVREVYGQKPELSEDICRLIELISGGSSDELTDYQRLKNIEKWLYSGEYDTEANIPGDAAVSPDAFLRYFLTEKTSGYCSYYATAFVLMARQIGMPARYIEGFQAPEGSREGTRIGSSMAHSWPEVYFEDVGWIRFEPTPGFEAVAEWGEPLREPEYYSRLGNGDNSLIVTEEIAADLTDEEAAELERRLLENKRKIREEKLRKRRMIITSLLIVVGSLAVVLAVFVALRFLISRIALKRAKGKKRIVLLCERNFTILGCLGMKPGKGETLEEFGKRIEKDSRIRQTGFIDIYERLLYSEEGKRGTYNDLQGDVSTAENDYADIRKTLAGSRNPAAKAKYLWYLITDRS